MHDRLLRRFVLALTLLHNSAPPGCARCVAGMMAQHEPFLAHAVTCSMLKIGAAVAVVDSQVAVASTCLPGPLQRCFLHSFAPMSTMSR